MKEEKNIEHYLDIADTVVELSQKAGINIHQLKYVSAVSSTLREVLKGNPKPFDNPAMNEVLSDPKLQGIGDYLKNNYEKTG